MADRPLRHLLNELAVFEAAARLASFSAAGRELGMSQSAVSHHVALLERELGTRLFHRVWRGVALTVHGGTLHEGVRRGLAAIDSALASIRAEGRRRHLTLVTDFAFATYWLLPRLDVLKAVVGGLDVHIVTTQGSSTFDLAVGDAAIVFGAEPGRAFDVTRLVEEEVVPVVGKAFLARHPTPDLRTAPLLHLDLPAAGRWLTWADYFCLLGWPRAAAPAETVFNNYPLLLQAAIAGQGVALGWRPLIDDLLARDLVETVAPPVRIAARGYDLLVKRDVQSDATLLAQLRAWLVQEFDAANRVNARAARMRP